MTTYAFLLKAEQIEKIIETVAEEMNRQDNPETPWCRASEERRARYIDKATDVVQAVADRFRQHGAESVKTA